MGDDRHGPDLPEVADGRKLNRAAGRTLRTHTAGVFRFLPLPAKWGFDRRAAEARYPSSEMVPTPAALRSPLALKLRDKERRGHIGDFNFDEVLGRSAGRNLLPKKSFATDYSYRPGRDQQRRLLQGWVQALAPVMFPDASGFSLDFHPIPYRGEPSGLDRHDRPRRGSVGPSVLTFFALKPKSRGPGYGNADLTRTDQNGALTRCVEFRHTVTGTDPPWLYFDSKRIDYAEMSRVNQRRIHVITIRGRDAAILRRLRRQPASDWKKAVIDTPKRCPQQRRSLEETGRRRGSEGPIRPLAVAGLGRDQPTRFRSNNVEQTPRERIIRSAGRNRIEDGLGLSVNGFHLDCLASEARLNVDLDAAWTVIANGGYRGLGSRLRGFAKAAPKQLDRRFVETAGTVLIQRDEITVTFERRSHNPILGDAALDRQPTPIPEVDPIV